MQRCGRLGWIIGVILLSVRPATADPVRITDGALDMGSIAGSLLLQGDGFLLSGGVTVNDGVFQPWLQCRLTPACVPGAVARPERPVVGLGPALNHGDGRRRGVQGRWRRQLERLGKRQLLRVCDSPGVHRRNRDAHRTVSLPG